MKFRWIGMSSDGNTVKLKRFSGFVTDNDSSQLNLFPSVKACVLDTETTGLDRSTDKIIEIGIREFCFNPSDGKIVSIGKSYCAYEDPGFPLPEFIIKLTGISDEDVKGQKISWDTVGSILNNSELIIAHNAAFDRPFVERYTRSSENRLWACSQKQISWSEKGFSSPKLELLSIYHGFYSDAHRALNDCDSLLNILGMNAPESSCTYLKELFEKSKIPFTRIILSKTPFEVKDLIKSRGYYWNSSEKSWYSVIPENQIELEISFLKSVSAQINVRIVSIPLCDSFKS